MSTQLLTGPERAAEPIRCAQRAEEHRYVARFDLPGFDAGQDLDVSVDAHVLTVRAERAAGAWRSVITLPAGTNDRDVAATYRDGILEVSVGWQDGPTARRIKILTLADAE
jgi:HSP20 family protein